MQRSSNPHIQFSKIILRVDIPMKSERMILGFAPSRFGL